MSDVSISNILPARTRSGRVRDVSHQESIVRPEPTVPAQEKPVTTKAQALDERYWVLIARCQELYRHQFVYAQNPGDRSRKFELMSEFTNLCGEIHSTMDEWSPLPHTYEDVARWVELVCWKSRITVFNQTVCVA